MKTIIEVNYFLCVIVVLVIKHHNVQVNNLYTSSVRKVYRHLSYYNDSITYKAEGKILLLEVKGDGITISKNKEHCEWEMRRDGKVFRYNLFYHLFEEINNT